MKTKLFLIITLVVLFAACKKNPTSCFAVPDKIVEGEPVDFQNCSTDATDYEWDFGDGTSSTIDLPTHIYTLAGNYSVSLTVKNGSKAISSSKKITLESPTGMLTFWAYQKRPSSDSLIVNTSAGIGYITQFYPNQISVDCGTVGCANFTLSANQTYHYQSNNLSGDVTVLKNQCKTILLY